MSALISEPQSPNKPKLLGTLDTDTDIVCHNHISGIYHTPETRFGKLFEPNITV
ncbi:MAG: hypothetical protein ACE5JB_13985 [bacterium]